MDNGNNHVGGYRALGKVEADLEHDLKKFPERKLEEGLDWVGLAQFFFIPGYTIKFCYDHKGTEFKHNLKGAVVIETMKVVTYANIAIIANELLK